MTKLMFKQLKIALGSMLWGIYGGGLFGLVLYMSIAVVIQHPVWFIGFFLFLCCFQFLPLGKNGTMNQIVKRLALVFVMSVLISGALYTQLPAGFELLPWLNIWRTILACMIAGFLLGAVNAMFSGWGLRLASNLWDIQDETLKK